MASFIATHVLRSNELASSEMSKGIVYVAEQSHHSVKQAVVLCGFPSENLRVIPSKEDDFSICLTSLKQTILKDIEEGLAPFLLIGFAGSTNTGAVDDLFSLSQLAKQYNLWFHVDAAYGGFFKLTKQGKIKLAHMELADSIKLAPHKSMFLPYGAGSRFVQKKKI